MEFILENFVIDAPVSPAPRLAPAIALTSAAALAGCGGGGGGGGGEGSGGGDSAAASTAVTSTSFSDADAAAARFLLQAQFSASTPEIAALRSAGPAQWLADQYASARGQTGWDWLNSRGYDLASFSGQLYPGDYMIWNQLMTGEDGMRRRMALALSEVFVVSLNDLNSQWRAHLIAGYWDVLTANAFGNFRTLLEAVTLNPAMGLYLDTAGNQKENTATGRQPDENYAREVMQLMTLGTSQLNADGTYQLDGNGTRIDTFTQADVTSLARVFTGYNLDKSQDTVSNGVSTPRFAQQPMRQDASRRSTQPVTLLGSPIDMSTGATALKGALDTLFNHSNVGPFFCRQMIQRLVTSNPSPGYVARVSATFNNNGAGVRGDLKAVWTALLTDGEARGTAGLTDPNFGKLREPMIRLVQWGRTFGIRSAQGSWKIGDQSNPAASLGQSPLRAPSVFNFFRPGYVPTSGTATAPEFQLVNETSVGVYLNAMQTWVRYGFYVNAPEQSATATNAATNGYDITAAYTAELALASDADALVQRLNLLLCAGQLSTATTSLIAGALKAKAVAANSTDALKLDRIAAAVLLVMASSEYLVQK